MTPSEVVEQHRVAIDSWVHSGAGVAYEFSMLDADADFTKEVREELMERGYAVSSRQEEFECDCYLGTKTHTVLGPVVIRVTRH